MLLHPSTPQLMRRPLQPWQQGQWEAGGEGRRQCRKRHQRQRHGVILPSPCEPFEGRGIVMVPVSKHQVWSPLEPIEGLLSILPRLRRRCLGLLVVCVRECLFVCMRVGMHARCVYLCLCALCLHYVSMHISTPVSGAVIPLEVERLVQASGGAVCKETQHYNASRCNMYTLLAVHFQHCACVRACVLCVLCGSVCLCTET